MTINQFFFRNRSYTPIPWLLVMVVFARPEPWSLITGFLIAALGEFTRASGVFYVGSETRVTGEVGASRLVTSGPFAHVRNPLYLGNMLMYLGIGIMSLALFPWLQIAAFLFFLLQYILIVLEEERFLREKFGDEYRRYTEMVPRFIPRLTASSEHRGTAHIDWKAGWRSETRTLQALGLTSLLILIIWFLQWRSIL